DPTHVACDQVICVNIPNVVRQAAIGVPNITVVVDYPTKYQPANVVKCADRGCPVSVTVSAPFVPLPSQYLLNGASQITLKGGSRRSSYQRGRGLHPHACHFGAGADHCAQLVLSVVPR